MTNWIHYPVQVVGRTIQIRKEISPTMNIVVHSINSDGWSANDVAGNYSVTLVDVLDTFVVMGDVPGFDSAVKNVIKSVSFNVNTRPQVFEATIRVLGGLLSGHIFASRPNQPFHLPWYNGELLRMAHDLGERLLPAFSTPTGIPYARVGTLGIIVSLVLMTTLGSLETRRTQWRNLRNLYVTTRSIGDLTPTRNTGTAGAGNLPYACLLIHVKAPSQVLSSWNSRR